MFEMGIQDSDSPAVPVEQKGRALQHSMLLAAVAVTALGQTLVFTLLRRWGVRLGWPKCRSADYQLFFTGVCPCQPGMGDAE